MKTPTIDELTKLIHHILNDNKAIDIKEIDVTKISNICDKLVVCTASSTRHASALAEKLTRAARKQNIKPLGIEGQAQSEWILVDFNDIIVHIMLSGTRDFYDLETLWTTVADNRQLDDH